MPAFEQIARFSGGELFAEFMQGSLLPFLRKPLFPETCSIILLILMVCLVGGYAYRIIPTYFRLKSLQKKLPKLRNNAEFIINELHNIKPFVSTLPGPLAERWDCFSKSWVQRGDGKIFLTSDPAIFFNLHALNLEGSLRRFSQCAGFFVGMGLLLTFLGLVAALSVATSGISEAAAGGGAAKMQTALQELLHAASFKFYTSVSGLSASLVISFCEKIFRSSLEKHISKLCNKIEQLVPFVTQEQLLAEQVEEAKQTTAQLKQFNTEMSTGLMTLSGDMAKALQDNISLVHRGLDQVGEYIKIMGQTIGNDILKALTEQLGKVVTQQAGNELLGLAETLKTLTAALSDIASSLEQGGGSFAETIGLAVQELQNGVAGLAQATRNMSQGLNQDLARALQEIKEQTKGVSDKISEGGREAAGQLTDAVSSIINGINDSVRKIGPNVDKLVESLAQANQAMTEHHQAVGEAASSTQAAAKVLFQASGSLNSAVNPVANSVKGMEASLNSLRDNISALGASAQQAASSTRDAANSLKQNWETHLGRFQDLDEDLAEVLQHIAEALDSNSTKLSEFVKEIDNQLAQTTGLLAQSVEDLEETLTEAIHSLRGAGQN